MQESIRDPRTLKACADIIEERKRQNLKWGIQRHKPEHYVLILNEELLESQTELSRLICDWTFRPDKLSQAPTILRRLREELVQVAAVAIAMIETIDEGLEGPEKHGYGCGCNDCYAKEAMKRG